jgi:hypothetical protein
MVILKFAEGLVACAICIAFGLMFAWTAMYALAAGW